MTGNELNSKNGVGWSWRPRRAERLLPKVATGRKFGGGLKAGGWGIAGSVLVNTVEARDRARDHPAHYKL